MNSNYKTIEMDNADHILNLALRDKDFWDKASTTINIRLRAELSPNTGRQYYVQDTMCCDLDTKVNEYARDWVFNAVRFHRKTINMFTEVMPVSDRVRPLIANYLEALHSGMEEAKLMFHTMSPEYQCVGRGSEAYAGSMTFDDAVDSIMKRVDPVLERVSKLDPEVSREVTAGWGKSIYSRRQQEALYHVDLNPRLDLAEWLQRITDRFSVAGSDVDLSELFFDSPFTDEDQYDCIQLPGGMYSCLKAVTGLEGLPKGGMIIAGLPSGGGKTTLCTQLMVEAAIQGRHCLYISSEMRKAEISARSLSFASFKVTSAWCIKHGKNPIEVKGAPRFQRDAIDISPYEPVPYTLLKRNGARPALWDDEVVNTPGSLRTAKMKAALLEAHNTIVGPYIHFVQVSEVKKVGINAVIESVNKTLESKYGNGTKVELVCLDWLGGSLIEDASDNGAEVRHIFYSTASAVADAAVKYNFAAVTTMQLNDEATDKESPSISTFAECKSVKDKACAAFTISAVKHDIVCKKVGANPDEHGAPDMDGLSKMSRKQTLNCGKSRDGAQGHWEVRRDFDFQYFNKL